MNLENKSSTDQISMLRSDSVNSLNTNSGRSSRLGKIFQNKHDLRNSFDFDINYSDLNNYKLQLAVKDDINYGAFSPKPVLGFLYVLKWKLIFPMKIQKIKNQGSHQFSILKKNFVLKKELTQ
uniref:Uncharacterized protein n=1 Tax=Heterorhabditis bacteriophora TaxID=37862 RepID=A0A1I7XSE8_HETBA